MKFHFKHKLLFFLRIKHTLLKTRSIAALRLFVVSFTCGNEIRGIPTVEFFFVKFHQKGSMASPCKLNVDDLEIYMANEEH